MDTTILAAILGPLITGLLGLAAVAGKQLQRTRRADDERARIVAQAAQEAAFIDSWLAAHQRVDLPPELHRQINDWALADLQRVYATLRSVDIAVNHHATGVRWGRVWRAALLLGVRRPWAMVVRVVYYVVSTFGLMVTVTVIAGFVAERPVMGVGDVAYLVFLGALATLYSLLPALALWAAARALDRPATARPGRPQTPPTPTPMPPAPPPGWGGPPSAWNGPTRHS